MQRVRRVILFCDISGFMRLAGSLGGGTPGFLQALYDLVGNAVVDRGGTLIKYLGEAVAHASVLNRVPGIVVTETVNTAPGGAFRIKELSPLR